MKANFWKKWPGWLIGAAVALLAIPGLAIDTDLDGMPDDYEEFFLLDPTNAADGASNYDDDTLVNSNEAALWTDPWTGDTDRDGFKDDADDSPLSRAQVNWGNSLYTTGDVSEYTWPSWMVGASKADGEWVTNPASWHVSAEAGEGVGSLWLDVDRNILSNDAVLRLDLFDHTNASLYLDLYDSGDATIVSNLFGNLMQGSNEEVSVRMDLPLETYTNAAGAKVRRGTGEVTVYESLLYVDKDGDGLDKEQEAQLGTSDNDADSDNDGLSDYAEELTYNTDPLDADTDNDGMNDGLELYHGRSPTSADSYSALPFTEEFETNTVQLGYVHAQNNWESSPTNAGIVQDSIVYAGSQALEVSDSSVATVSHLFSAPAGNLVWADMYLKAVACVTPSGAVTDTSAFHIDAQGRLVVYDANQWVTLTNHEPVTTGTWVRLTTKLDYGAQEWELCLNGALVATNLGFGASASQFSQIAIGAEEAFADSIKITTNAPSDFDLDSDSIPDWWEYAYGLNPYSSADASQDADSDGLTNLQEYQQGTSPTDSDSDNDGMSDGLELYHGRSPTSADSYNALPFTEEFETNTVQLGYVHAQNNWEASPTNAGVVQDSTVYAGSQALEISESNVVTVSHLFASPETNIVWVDMYLEADEAVQPYCASTDSASMYFNGQGRLVVRDGSQWLVLTNETPVSIGSWARLTVKLDYGQQKWLVCVNGVMVADALNFAASASQFSAFALDGADAHADSLDIGIAEPALLSLDWDNLPDSWEQAQFGDLDEVDSGDPDSDGFSNLAEYQSGTNPNSADTDNDGLLDWYEVNVSGTDPTSADSDSDGLNDRWEYWYGMNPLIADNPNADPDGDGLTNAQEETNNTNPFLDDSDGDGVSDSDEITNETNPLVADQNPTGGPTVTIISPKDGEYILW